MSRNLFLLIGAQKSGTTSIYTALEHQPNLILTKEKESKFFVRDDYYDQGTEYYWNQFRSADSTHAPFLDVDPDLFHFDYVPQRIFEAFGSETRFILILRNPVDRAWSAYQMEKFRKRETLSFAKAIASEEDRVKLDRDAQRFGYLRRGLYYKQLQEYLKYFSFDNFKVFLFEEDFLSSRKAMFAQMGRFMGMEISPELPIDIKRNPTRKIKSGAMDTLLSGDNVIRRAVRAVISEDRSRRWKEKLYEWNASQNVKESLTKELRKDLINNYFMEDIIAMENILGRDLSAWKHTD